MQITFSILTASGRGAEVHATTLGVPVRTLGSASPEGEILVGASFDIQLRSFEDLAVAVQALAPTVTREALVDLVHKTARESAGAIIGA